MRDKFEMIELATQVRWGLSGYLALSFMNGETKPLEDPWVEGLDV